ncbi:MAG: hypothetical protein OHK0021_24390 [Bryobacter sp.]
MKHMADQSMFSLFQLFLFPVFQTREEYKQHTGEEAPPWNPNQPVKNWFDPAARTTRSRTMLYDRVLLYDENGMAIPDAAGRPQLDNLALLREIAAEVNMLPSEKLVDYGPGGRMAPIPVPLRELKPEEELFFTFGGAVAVRLKGAFKTDVNAFTVDDRTVLYKIAEKLGVA